MASDSELVLDLLAEDLPAGGGRGPPPRRGAGDRITDFYIPWTAPDGERYLVRLRCDGYDGQAPSFQFVNPGNPEETGPQWWARMGGLGYPRGDRGEVVFCTPGIREYHQHPSHRGEAHPKAVWKLARVVALTWTYLNQCGPYAGRGGI